jgi:threonine aldolase
MGRGMRFFSDNAAAVCPEVMAALAAANSLDTAYDGDRWSKRLDGAFSELFGTEVTALWVATGTAANSLALAAMCPPHGSIVCHRDAHIQNDECGAPEFYTHGAKLLLGEGEGAKLTPRSVAALLAGVRDDVHQAQPAALSITNATEYGLVYTPDEVAALGALARERGLAFHVDGARFANAVVRTGASVADLTWRAGVDALSFGFAKNGGMSAEVLVFFRPEYRQATLYRRKRAGHLLSKGRYMAAQILACSRTASGCAMRAPRTTARPASPRRRARAWCCRSRPMSCSSASARRRRRRCATRASTSTTGVPARPGW